MQLLRSTVTAVDRTPGNKCSISRQSLSIVGRNASPRCNHLKDGILKPKHVLTRVLFFRRKAYQGAVKLAFANALNASLIQANALQNNRN